MASWKWARLKLCIKMYELPGKATLCLKPSRQLVWEREIAGIDARDPWGSRRHLRRARVSRCWGCRLLLRSFAADRTAAPTPNQRHCWNCWHCWHWNMHCWRRQKQCRHWYCQHIWHCHCQYVWHCHCWFMFYPDTMHWYTVSTGTVGTVTAGSCFILTQCTGTRLALVLLALVLLALSLLALVLLALVYCWHWYCWHWYCWYWYCWHWYFVTGTVMLAIETHKYYINIFIDLTKSNLPVHSLSEWFALWNSLKIDSVTIMTIIILYSCFKLHNYVQCHNCNLIKFSTREFRQRFVFNCYIFLFLIYHNSYMLICGVACLSAKNIIRCRDHGAAPHCQLASLRWTSSGAVTTVQPAIASLPHCQPASLDNPSFTTSNARARNWWLHSWLQSCWFPIY